MTDLPDAPAGTPEPPAAEAPAAPAPAPGRFVRFLPYAGFLLAVLYQLRTHLLFMWPYSLPVSNDEGYLAAMSLRMFRGHWLPYVDGVSQRGPILYWLTALFMRVGGIWSWLPMRLLGLTLSMTMLGLVFALGRALFSPVAGALGSLVCAYFLNHELNPWDGVGVNGEPLAVCFALGAALLVTALQKSNPEHNRTQRLFWLGLLCACAGLSKQMFLLHTAPVGLWLLLGRADGKGADLRSKLREIGFFATGFTLPYLLVLGLYAGTGHLGTFLYYYQRYGREIFMAPLTRSVMRDKLYEVLDRYFLGVAAFGVMFSYALGSGVRTVLEEPDAEKDPEDAREGLSFRSPEGQVLSNLLFPGLGLLTARGLRGAGAAFAALVLGSFGAYVPYRLSFGSEAINNPRFALLWFLEAVAAGLLTAWLLTRKRPALAWNGLRALRARPEMLFACLQTALALGGVCFTFRFFPHYFVEFFPFAAVLVGGALAPTLGEATTRASRWGYGLTVLGAGVLLVLASFVLTRNVVLRREFDRWYQHPLADPIVRYVLERTTPEQTIFVWGFRAETYLSAHRWPASRFIYTVYPSGVVPWFPATPADEEDRVVPGSREQLLEDLDREQPEMVIDAGRSMSGRYMYNYPTLRAYLDRNYCFLRYVDGEPVYRRRHTPRCPPADY